MPFNIFPCCLYLRSRVPLQNFFLTTSQSGLNTLKQRFPQFNIWKHFMGHCRFGEKDTFNVCFFPFRMFFLQQQRNYLAIGAWAVLERAERNSDSVVAPSDLLKGSWLLFGWVGGFWEEEEEKKGEWGGIVLLCRCCFLSSYLRESCGFSKPESSSYWGRINHEEREGVENKRAKSKKLKIGNFWAKSTLPW